MNTDNVGIVIMLVIGIVILANLAMFAVVRGSRDMNLPWFKGSKDNFSQPFNLESKSMRKLHEQVEQLSKQKPEGE